MDGPDPVEHILISLSSGVLAKILLRTHCESQGLRSRHVASVVDSEDV